MSPSYYSTTLKLALVVALFSALGYSAPAPNQGPRGAQRRLSPVIFIPGNGGSQLEAKVDASMSARSYGCEERTGWFRLWLNVWDMILGEYTSFDLL